MKEHPELMHGEIFLTNCKPIKYNSIGWKTKRMGELAYYRNGDLIGPSYRPVFIKFEEVEDLEIRKRLFEYHDNYFKND